MALFFYHVVFGVRYLGILNGVAAFVIIGIGKGKGIHRSFSSQEYFDILVIIASRLLADEKIDSTLIPDAKASSRLSYSEYGCVQRRQNR